MAKMNVSLDSLKKEILSSKPPHNMETRIVAIDGCGGAGKTTFATCLSEILGTCSIVRTDDFASWENPVNWYPRLIDQVLIPLRTNKPTKYRRFDWASKQMAEWIDLKPGGIVILEGVCSSRKEFRDFLSFSIFVKTDRSECLRRGLERDGKDTLEQWRKWMEEEDRYLERDRPEQFANLVIDGERKLS